MSLTDHVAIALDFSEPSEVAARAGFELGRIVGAKRLTVLHATRDVVLPAGDTPELRARLEALRSRLNEAARAELDQLCERVSAAPCERAVVNGRPSEVIPRALREMGASLLVLGTHARKGLRRVFVGSIAEDLLRNLEIPALVTLIGDDRVAPDRELRALRHIVVGLDLTNEALQVVDSAASLFAKPASERPLTVHLVHTLERPREIEGLMRGERETPRVDAISIAEDLQKAERARAEGMFDQFEPLLRARGFEVERHIVEGEFEEFASSLVHDLPAQLLVVGTHGRDQAPLLELGSTTVRMIRASNVSVLVVPSRGPDSKDHES